jgi:hypothetical protein
MNIYQNLTSLALYSSAHTINHNSGFITSHEPTFQEQLPLHLSLPSSLLDNLWKGSPTKVYGAKQWEKSSFDKSQLIFAEKVSPPKELNGIEVAEAFPSEACFTIATDKKPIVATYAFGPYVYLGGYEATNKIAFIVHFSNAGEVREADELIFNNISKLAKKKIEKIELHLRGGVKGQSEKIIKAIKNWIEQRKNLPMEIASEEILLSEEESEKGLSIDSRNGEVSEYDALKNPRRREITVQEFISIIESHYEPHINLAYSPK